MGGPSTFSCQFFKFGYNLGCGAYIGQPAEPTIPPLDGPPQRRSGTTTQLNSPSFVTTVTAYRWFIENGGRFGTGWSNQATVARLSTTAPFDAQVCIPHIHVPLLIGERGPRRWRRSSCESDQRKRRTTRRARSAPRGELRAEEGTGRPPECRPPRLRCFPTLPTLSQSSAPFSTPAVPCHEPLFRNSPNPTRGKRPFRSAPQAALCAPRRYPPTGLQEVGGVRAGRFVVVGDSGVDERFPNGSHRPTPSRLSGRGPASPRISLRRGDHPVLRSRTKLGSPKC